MRGFEKLEDKTITKVTIDAVNHVILTTADGFTFSISADCFGQYKIPVLELTEIKEQGTEYER